MSTIGTVAVAGASGFVGRALVADLARRHRVVALGRRARTGPADGPEWRTCDLYSLSGTEQALAGCDVAVYLVHSMAPDARLVQASFEDLDLILADNFARAAARNGVRRIVYLGGLLPERGGLSPHLASRREVELALAAHGVPVTCLRAGLVIGDGGSSLEILLNLVRRLPVMVCPSWTATRTQPIALEDTVAALSFAVENEDTAGRVAEIGGPDVMTYRELMATAARALGLRRWFLSVPFLSPRLSRLWVTLFSSQPAALVEPLVESLRHEMVVDDPWLQRAMGRPGRPIAEALRRVEAGDAIAPPAPPPLVPAPPRVSAARSVQRLPLPPDWTATDVASEYVSWLPVQLRFVLRAVQEGDTARFRLSGSRHPALILELVRARSEPDRAVLRVTGGWLLRRVPDTVPRLEFRRTPDGASVLAAVHEFTPRLPWLVYRFSQALVHLWVMRRFGRHLDRRARER